MIKRMIIVLSADALLLLMAVAGVSAQKVDVPQREGAEGPQAHPMA